MTPRRTRVRGPSDEEVARLEEQIERVEEEMRTVERLAAHYGLGSSGLLQGPVPPASDPPDPAPQPSVP